MELTPEEKKHWIDPIVIDNKKDAEAFICALEMAAAAPKKHIEVNYREVTNKDEIKKLFSCFL